MKFSDSLWEEISPIYEKIIKHPFNTELAEGTLSQDTFLFYLRQDADYLVSFSRALALIAARADSATLTHLFLKFSQEALLAERDLHKQFLPQDSLNEPTALSPACIGYTQYLLATAATASLEEAMAASLPCFWIYREVGISIAKRALENNPFQKWIDTYSSKEFAEGTTLAITLLDEIARTSSLNTLARMKAAFECSALFEWHFWNDAYHHTLFRELPSLATICT